MHHPPSISNAAIAGAAVITAKDPATVGWFLLWRSDTVAIDEVNTAASTKAKSIEVSVRDDDDDAMLELIGRIEQIKGTLPWEAQALRSLIQSLQFRQREVSNQAASLCEVSRRTD